MADLAGPSSVTVVVSSDATRRMHQMQRRSKRGFAFGILFACFVLFLLPWLMQGETNLRIAASILPVAGALAVVWYMWLEPRNHGRVARDRWSGYELRYRLGEQGVRIETSDGLWECIWQAVEEPKESGGFWQIKQLRNGEVLAVVPASSFADVAAFQAFMQEALRLWKAAWAPAVVKPPVSAS